MTDLKNWSWIREGKYPSQHVQNGVDLPFDNFVVHFMNKSSPAQVRRPVPFPCFGDLKKEKHVLLPSVADVVIEQGNSWRV